MVSGTVKSEPGFVPALDAQLHGVGYDYIHNDANGGNMRLDVRSQVKYVHPFPSSRSTRSFGVD